MILTSSFTQTVTGLTMMKQHLTMWSDRLGNRTFPKNGKQRACKIPKIYGAVEKMPRTSYVRYIAQSVHKTEYNGHRTYGTPHKTGQWQTNNIGR